MEKFSIRSAEGVPCIECGEKTHRDYMKGDVCFECDVWKNICSKCNGDGMLHMGTPYECDCPWCN